MIFGQKLNTTKPPFQDQRNKVAGIIQEIENGSLLVACHI